MNTETPYSPPGANANPAHDTLPGRAQFFDAMPNLGLLLALFAAIAAIIIGMVAFIFPLALAGVVVLLAVMAIWAYGKYFGQKMAK
jgi:hypothetical protein